MDIILPIIFLIFFVIVVIIVTYLIYDYMQYKKNVDTSIKSASSQINKEFEKVIYNVDMHSSNIETVDNKVHNYDSSLRKFFSFNDENNNVITNQKMFNHAFDGIIPNLELISQVNSIGGMSIKTSTELINDKNMKICNDTDSCVDMNVNRNGFHITPNSKVNNISINDNDKFPLASFDLANKSIYLGGDNQNNSPFYIKDDEVHIKNAKMYKGSSGDFLTASGIDTVLQSANDNTDYTASIATLDTRYAELQNNITDIQNVIVIQYFITLMTGGNSIKITFLINNKTDIDQGKTIQFKFNKSIINPFVLNDITNVYLNNDNSNVNGNAINSSFTGVTVEDIGTQYLVKFIIGTKIHSGSFIYAEQTVTYDGTQNNFLLGMHHFKESNTSGVIHGNVIQTTS